MPRNLARFAFALSTFLACACGQELGLPCSSDSQCAPGDVCTSGACENPGDPLTAVVISASPASQSVRATVGEVPGAAEVTLKNSDSVNHPVHIACTGAGATPSETTVSIASGASASLSITFTAPSAAGTETATCTGSSSSGKTTWVTFTISVVATVSGSGGGSGGGSAGGSGGGSAGGSGESDGPPTRTAACTPFSEDTGKAIDTSHGRLDGIVTFVLPLDGASTCNGDSGHVHIEVSAGGDIYDVAVDVGTSPGDALLYETDMAMPDGAWSEGWHDDALSYKSLGIKSTVFTSEDPAPLAQKLEAELASVNHISVFGTAYSTKNGCHDVHYENGSDGALVLQPLSATPHILFFRFSTDSF